MADFEIKNGVGIIPEGTTKLDWSSFEKCTELTSVVIPDSVKRMECWDYRRVSCVTLFPPFSQKELIEHLVEGRGEVEFHQSEEGERSWRDWN